MALFRFFCFSSLFLSCISSFVSAASSVEAPPGLPWFTGPLIAPPGTVTPKGHLDIEPFLYVTTNTGLYDEHWHSHSEPNFVTVNPVVLTYFGVTEWMDFQFDPQLIYNRTEGESFVHLGDFLFGFDFQLLSAEKWKWVPGIKFALLESFPLGKYQKLNPKNKKTDATGSGSFETQTQLVFYKLFHIENKHYLSATLAFECIYSAPVHVRGFNTYGGGHGTSGKVYPGNEFSTILSFEYSLDEHWVLALDNVYTHANKTRFSGNSGYLTPGTPATVGEPSSEQLSFAPAIEYNFNVTWGLIAGAWVTAAGRNSTEFRSGVIALNYNH